MNYVEGNMVRMFTNNSKKVNLDRNKYVKPAIWVLTFIVIGGLIGLLRSFAAVPVVIDSSVPQPRNVRAFADDRILTVTWDRPTGTGSNNVVGYYITYREAGSSSAQIVRQTEYEMIQLQPVVNGTEYEITVQSARGTYQDFTNTTIGDSFNRFARADGRVSQPVSTTGTPSDAKVVAQRQRLTGFFDDFNTPANPFDELKWNNAASGCAEVSTGSAFINAQYHAHNTVRSGFCDRGGFVSRPRANLNTAGFSENNPVSIEFDIDGVTQGRDTWYLDIIPTESRRDGSSIDITSHNDLAHTDTEDPPNILRINPTRDGVKIVYYDMNRIARDLPINTPNTACEGWWSGETLARWQSCDMSIKTNGISPLEQPTKNPAPVANVRRHWVAQMTPTKVRVYVDSVLVAEADLPAEFANKQTYIVHSTLFSYSTGKDHNPGWAGAKAYPYVQFFHWDNFGFSGPAPSTVIHNYIDGGPDGLTPSYLANEGPDNPPRRGNRTTIIPVPDQVGNLVNNQGHLYFTIQNLGYQQYTWREGDHILFNGVRYEFTNPRLNMVNPNNDVLTHTSKPYSAAIQINRADIRTGNNTVDFNFTGSGNNVNRDFINVHLELPYSRSDTSRPAYTQPIQIFGDDFSKIVEPRFTNCDQYNFIEQDLDLPYDRNKPNLQVGPCFLLPMSHHHNPDFFGPNPTPLPPPDTQAPSVNLTAPNNNTTLSGNSIEVTATATDNVGVNRVEFYVGGILRATDTSSPYSATLDFTSLAPGTYPIYAIAYDSAGNTAQTSSRNAIKPVPPDATAPTVSLTAPASNVTLAQGTTNLTLSANASDNVAVSRVDFYFNGGLYAQDTSAPYTTAVNVGSLQPGNYIVFARAFDAAGNTAQTVTRTVTVPSPPPQTCPVGQTGTPPNCVTPTPDPVPTPQPNRPGDVNGDSKIDRNDLRIMLFYYGKNVPSNNNGDLNNDGRVDRNDLRILLFYYGR